MPTHREVFAAITRELELPDDYVLTPETTIASIPGWDSLGWVAVIAAMEELTGREFVIERVDQIATLGNLLEAIGVPVPQGSNS